MNETKKKTVAEALTEIAEKHDGAITPEIVLRHAKKRNSVLHQHFEWDDSKAAEAHRLTQAATLIRKVRVTYEPREDHEVRVRGWINVHPEEPGDPEHQRRGVYVPLETAMSDDEYRAEMLANATRDAKAFRMKYAALSELSKIHEAIDELKIA